MASSPGPGFGTWPDESPRLASRFFAGAVAAFLLIVGLANILCVGGLAAAILIVPPILSGAMSLDEAADPANLGAGVFAASFFAGFIGFLLCGLGLVAALGWRLRHAVGWRGPTWAGIGVATAGGLVVGFFPGWIAQQLREAMPSFAENGTLEAIQRILESNDPIQVGLLLWTVSVGAPILEELCFRGLLWNALERVFPGGWGQWLAFAGTSLAFAAAHFDPIQAPAITFTAFFFGWLRKQTGSVFPGIWAHFLNTALASVFGLLIARGVVTEEPASWILAAVGVVLTLAFGAVLIPLRRNPPATPEAAWEAQPS
jgi:membrane protease YdiL (CAAX protease family)